MTKEYQKGLAEALQLAPVVPVMVIENVEDAVPLARALVKGGLPVLEITLRTAKAMDCIRAIIAEVEGAIVGSGAQVLGPITVGAKARIGANAVVTRDVPEGATMIGIPAKPVVMAAEDYVKPFLPYGTPCAQKFDPETQKLELLRCEMEVLKSRRDELTREDTRKAG